MGLGLQVLHQVILALARHLELILQACNQREELTTIGRRVIDVHGEGATKSRGGHIRVRWPKGRRDIRRLSGKAQDIGRIACRGFIRRPHVPIGGQSRGLLPAIGPQGGWSEWGYHILLPVCMPAPGGCTHLQDERVVARSLCGRIPISR